MYETFGDGFFMKGYSFAAGSRLPGAMHATYFIMPLFLDNDTIAYTFGKELYYSYREGLFNLNGPASREDAFKLLNVAIDVQGEPVLAKFNTPRDAYHAQKKDMKDNIRV